jgi:hypothetical protein
VKPVDQVKRFATNNLLIEAALDQAQTDLSLRVAEDPSVEAEIDETYYPQFDEKYRAEAADMAVNFRIFYCLENSIRELILDALSEEFNDDWWVEGIPENIRLAAEKLRQKEIDTGGVPRSDNLLDYTTFGELAQIIEQRQQAFEGKFTSFKAVNKVLWQLNMLRGPIAHCKPLAEDEVLRLHLSLRDWFRAQGE